MKINCVKRKKVIELCFIPLQTNNRDVSDYRTDLLLCNRTSTRPGYFLGNLPGAVSPAPYSGTVYVQDRNIIFIQLFSYSAELDSE